MNNNENPYKPTLDDIRLAKESMTDEQKGLTTTRGWEKIPGIRKKVDEAIEAKDSEAIGKIFDERKSGEYSLEDAAKYSLKPLFKALKSEWGDLDETGHVIKGGTGLTTGKDFFMKSLGEVVKRYIERDKEDEVEEAEWANIIDYIKDDVINDKLY